MTKREAAIISAYQQFAGNPYLYEAAMYKKHFCKNGSVGLAFFAGFMRVK